VCSRKYHLQCVKIKDVLVKTLNACKNLFWFGDDCVADVNSKLEVNKSLHKLEQSIQECKQNTIDILIHSEDKPESYGEHSGARVLKMQQFPPLIIPPKNGNQDSTITKNIVTIIR
ncbi:hypothetical protein WA026_002623, partial [Henosepilachna vigintioctopunctata]